MNLYQAIEERRSIRQYKADPVPQEKVRKILTAANWAPSGRNMQPWKFYVISSGKLGQDWSHGAPLVIAATMPKAENPRRMQMHLQSVAAAFQNMLLAAYAEGLGTCWMTGPLADDAALRTLLDLPDDEVLVAVTPLGYPDESIADKPRLDPDLQTKLVWVD